jgi:anti-sigma B factor antagonist
MDFKVEASHDKIVIRIIGEVTAETCGELRDAVIELIRKAPQSLVLDLSDMPFIDTSGLGVLVGLRAQAKKGNVTLTVQNPQARILQVFRITQLAKVFGIPTE